MARAKKAVEAEVKFDAETEVEKFEAVEPEVEVQAEDIAEVEAEDEISLSDAVEVSDGLKSDHTHKGVLYEAGTPLEDIPDLSPLDLSYLINNSII